MHIFDVPGEAVAVSERLSAVAAGLADIALFQISGRRRRRGREEPVPFAPRNL